MAQPIDEPRIEHRDAQPYAAIKSLATVEELGTVLPRLPDGLIDVVAALLNWAEKQGLVWDSAPWPAGDRWGCRLEIYLTDSPDMDTWDTELAIRVA